MSVSSRLFLCFAVTLVLAIVALTQGVTLPVEQGVEQQILLHLRLPAVLTALIVGAGLSVSAASLQVLLKNPLADPGIIGITSGASLCAALMLLGAGDTLAGSIQYLLPLACFVGALASTMLIYFIASRLMGMGHGVILAGIAISTLTGAVVAWLHLFSDAQSMRNLTFWLMGSLNQANWPILSLAGPSMLSLLVYSLAQGKRLNLYYFGANSAQLAGLDVSHFHRSMLIVCALMVGIAVSIAGSIAFIGLLVPHLLRNLWGYDNRLILPASALVGGSLMLLVMISSYWFGGVSVPVSMLTASIGGPVFLLSMSNKVRGSSRC